MMTSSADTSAKNSRLRRLTALALILILLLGAFLRFYQLGAGGYGNDYYAATVKSMLTSWHNFFFVSYEPGGSVTVDKPPLGFWIEALSALIFGLNGFALALPNALAGVLSILVVFFLVRKPFGRLPALLAALVLATLPITIVTERNNTIDGMLVFTLLLAAWAFVKSVDTRKMSWLVLGAVLIGLAFNIKMLQAFMVLPALYLFYLLGAKFKWWQRFLHLGLATLVLAAVSLSWVLIVDAVPANQRPYVGSSSNNSELELIVGHNGLDRFSNSRSTGSPRSTDSGSNNLPFGNGNFSMGAPGFAPNAGGNLQRPDDGNRVPGGGSGAPGNGMDTGTAGLLRLFQEPLATQASWLLPLVFLSCILAFALRKKLTLLSEQRLSLILWAAWLLPAFLYFTFTGGLWHTYYLIMLGPAIAALTGISFWTLNKLRAITPLLAKIMLTLFSAATLAFELYAVSSYPAYFKFFAFLLGSVWGAATLLYWLRPRRWTLLLVLLSLILAPLLWSGLSVFNASTNTNLPSAEPARNFSTQTRTIQGTQPAAQQKALLDYLLANTPQGSYLLATMSAQQASSFILATNRPVLTFGGFTGSDNIISADEFASMVSAGTVRFVLDGGTLRQKSNLYTWVKQNCRVVQVPGLQSSAESAPRNGGGLPQSNTLYDCSPAY